MPVLRLLAPALLVLALLPAAGGAATHTLAVEPEASTSVTLTLPRDGSANLTAGGAAVRIGVRKGELAAGGRSIGRTRTPRSARLIVANTRGRTTVTLSARVLAVTAARTVTLRGAATVRDPFSASVGDPLDRLAQRAGMLHLARPRTLAYLGQGTDGELHYRPVRNWVAAFLPGLLWQVAASRRSALHARWAWEELRDLRGAARFDDPDVGFVFWRAALRAHELGCGPGAALALTSGRCAELLALTGEAADRLVARSASNPLGLIPTATDEALCSQCRPGELRVIVDQLHNLPALLAAGGASRTALAREHARWVAANLVRPDGSVYQEAFIDRDTGALIRRGNFQGHSNTSVWARGQAWAISGLALTATRLGDAELLATAVRSADWWLAHVPRDGLPPYDFGAPSSAPRDSSALAIAAVGLRALAARCGATGDCDGTPYADAAAAARGTLSTALSTGAQLGRLGDGAYTVGGAKWDERAELAWGSDFLGELLAG